MLGGRRVQLVRPVGSVVGPGAGLSLVTVAGRETLRKLLSVMLSITEDNKCHPRTASGSRGGRALTGDWHRAAQPSDSGDPLSPEPSFFFTVHYVSIYCTTNMYRIWKCGALFCFLCLCRVVQSLVLCVLLFIVCCTGCLHFL